MSIANQLESEIMGQVFGNTSFALNTSFFAQLHIGDPGETATANPLQNCELKAVVWNAATSTVNNATTITWTCSATGTITHLSLHDTSVTAVATNGLWSGALTASKVVANVNDQVQLASAALVVTLT